MKRTISSVPQLYRNVRRWSEIVSVLSKYGLADWLSRFNIDFLTDLLRTSSEESQSQITKHTRIRLALSELGPTFIKFGQLLSTRPDLIGHELAEELAMLQADTPCNSFESVRKTIEDEQGVPLEDIFLEFDPVPIASASIGQVHLAKLHREFSVAFDRPGRKNVNDNGADVCDLDVVVKIRHAGIEKKIDTDLDILAGLAQLASRLEDLRNYDPVAIVREMSRTLRRELDFEREERNLFQFRALFEKDSAVLIPEPIPRLCSSRMITMQRIRGINLRELRDSPDPDIDLEQLARAGANLYLKMIFNHGFYHADPHPGNILIMDDGTIGLIDFGMVGRISERLREDIETMLVAIVNQDVMMLTAMVRRVGKCPLKLDQSAFSNDIADFVGQYSTQEVANFDMSGALNDFVQLIRRFEITLPSEAALLIKTLVSLEGSSQLISPQFCLMEVMKPFQRMLILKRLSPRRQIRKMRRFYLEVEQLADSLPNRISNILEQVQTGSFDVHLDHRRLGPTVNRLVLGLMTSALFLGSALMMSYKVPPLFFPGKGPWGIHDLSLMGITGLIASMMLGLRLIWAIRKSGNLDQPD